MSCICLFCDTKHDDDPERCPKCSHLLPRPADIDLPYPVELDRDDLYRAGYIGTIRNVDAILEDRRSRHDRRINKKDAWAENSEGAFGELSVSIWTGVPWNGSFGDLDAGDVGDLLEVRTTPSAEYYLKIQKSDKIRKPYIHVTGPHVPDKPGRREFVTMLIHGYRLAGECLRPEWYHDLPPPYAKRRTGLKCYWVPTEYLHRDLGALKNRFLAAYEGRKNDKRAG